MYMYKYIYYIHPNILQILRIKSVDTQINKTIKSKQPTHLDTNITPVFWHLLVEGCCSIGVSNMPIDLKDAAMLEGSYQRWAEDSGDETKVTALTWATGDTKVCWLILMLHVHQPEIPSHCTKIPPKLPWTVDDSGGLWRLHKVRIRMVQSPVSEVNN